MCLAANESFHTSGIAIHAKFLIYVLHMHVFCAVIFFSDFPLVLFTENPSDRLLFTTDGTDPKSRGAGNTHHYSGAFKLRAGKRTVKAMAVSRYDMAVIRCDMVVSR